jgi:hypothetical protein
LVLLRFTLRGFFERVMYMAKSLGGGAALP